MTGPTATVRYGSWESPLTAAAVAEAGGRLTEICLDGNDVYWLERRPAEKGRTALVRRTPSGQVEDALPGGWNVRTTVHDYGGGSYAAAAGTVWFSNFSDQRVYRLDPGGEPRPITPAGPFRFADYCLDQEQQRIYCVREDHTDSDQHCRNELVLLDAGTAQGPRVVAGGRDFYSSPRLSPDGRRLLWLAWDQPLMPWDGAELWVADVSADGGLTGARHVAGSAQESICQPAWSPSGVMHCVSDRSGWWNLYREVDGALQPILRRDAEFARPHWVFGQSAYSFVAGGALVAAYGEEGFWSLGLIRAGELEPVPTGYRDVEYVQGQGDQVFFVGHAPDRASAVVKHDLRSGRTTVLAELAALPLDATQISLPEAVDFPTSRGALAHGLYYPPLNPRFTAPEGDLPPLLVNVHGGPTSAADTWFDPEIQFFTSRGFAYLDLNYRGSTGYGRAYRDALKGGWGIIDVDDSIAGARHLVDRGLADPERVAIRGGSAGGFTTLAALTTRDYFKAGASYYGIADASQMEADGAKFELMYDPALYGGRQLYAERSPINHVDQIRAPLIIFQGLEDAIVPPKQAELMVAALRRNRVPHAYLAFPGEGHGFRQAANIARAAEAELYFYGRVFRLELAGELHPVEIAYLE